MESKQNKTLGNKGEEIACEFLKKRGFEILEKNFRTGNGEIDIIAKYNDTIRFIEVKTRHSEDFQDIEDAISYQKIDKINVMAEEWFFKKNYPESFWQIDFIGIILASDGSVTKLVFLEDI